MSTLAPLLLAVDADPADPLAKKMLPIYLKEAQSYSIAVASAPKKPLDVRPEPVFEWSNPTRSLAARVANLTDGTGSATRANGNYFLTNATVFNDTSSNELDGKQEADWYFANSRDQIERECEDLLGEQ